MLTTQTVKFAASKGKQKPERFAGEPLSVKHVLFAKNSKLEEFFQAGQTLTTSRRTWKRRRRARSARHVDEKAGIGQHDARRSERAGGARRSRARCLARREAGAGRDRLTKTRWGPPGVSADRRRVLAVA